MFRPGETNNQWQSECFASEELHLLIAWFHPSLGMDEGGEGSVVQAYEK